MNVARPLIFQMKPTTDRSLVLAELSGNVAGRFWVTYIQFPEYGRPSGGRSGWWDESCFHEPAAADELLWLHLYETAKRVIDLKQELASAEADADAARRYAKLSGYKVREL